MLKEVNKLSIFLIGIILVCGMISAWSVEITSPSNGSLLGEKPTQFIWNTNTSINNLQNNFLFIINGNENPGLTNRSELKEALKIKEIKEGWNELNISVTNNTGSIENNSVSFWVDSIHPVIEILNLNNPIHYTKNGFFKISAKLNESNPKSFDSLNLLKLIQFKIWSPGEELSDSPNYIDTPEINVLNISSTQTGELSFDGLYIYNVLARDTIGHQTIKNGTIILDTQKPIVNFTNLIEGQFISGIFELTTNSQDILKDNYQSGINHTILNVTPEQICIDGNCAFSWNTTNLSEGNYTIKATTYDKAGNSNSSQINVIVDNTPPISNNSATGFWMNSDFNITINASDFGSEVAYINYSLNGTSWIQVFRNETKVLINESGNQSLEYFAVDNAGNIETINLVYVLLDKIAPNTTTEFDYLKWYNVNVTITLNATDTLSGVKEIWYKVNNNNWTNVSGNNTSILISDEGINNLTYFAIDNAGNNETNQTINITIDKTPPTISVQSPTNYNYTTKTIWFNATANEEVDSWIVNYNGTTNLTSFDINSFLEVDDGIYNLLIYAEDKAGNIGLNDSISFIVDTTGPEINITNSPSNNSVFNWENRTQIINFSANDLYSNVDSCLLYVNNEKYNLTELGNNSYINISNYSAGTHSWHISCNDSAGNPTQTETRYFTILSNFTNAGEYNYTDLTNETDISEVLYFYINNSNGMINWTEAINFSTGFDWSECINISQENIFINSTCSKLNKSATLIFYNITFSIPEVMKDGISFCKSNSCYDYNLSANILSINITKSGNYVVVQNFVSTDSLTTTTPSGGSSTTYYKCSEWEEWSECIEGTQTRTCEKKESVSYSRRSALGETRTCIVSIPQIQEEIVEEIEQETEIQIEDEKGFFAGITGGVIGVAKSGIGIMAMVFIVLVSAGAIGVTLFRKYR